MTSVIFPKRRDLKLTPKLSEFGFTKVYSIGKLLVLSLGMDGREIRCRFDNKDLIKTTERYLKTALEKSNFSGSEIEVICTHVCQILLDSIEKEHEQTQSEKRKEQENTKKILEEIKQLRELNANLTLEQWQSKLQEKYNILYDTVQIHLPEIWTGLEFSLSTLRILNIHKCTLPFIGLLLGRPGSGKTICLRLLRKWYCTFSSDNFTPRAFQSHSTAVSSKEELEEIDMLPKLKNRLFLTPELAPTFSGKEDDLTEMLGLITRIADGHGLASDSGAHGHREYGDTMFTWVGSTVDVPNKVFRIMATLGPKLYFFRLPFKDKTRAELLREAMEDEDFEVKEQQIQEALFDYLKWFDIGPNLILSEDNPIPKMQWDRSRDNDDGSMSYIINLAELLSYLRRSVEILDYGYGDSDDLGFSASAREDVSRTRFVLYNLARGHALLTGRNYITLQDVPLVVKTILSTAQIDRVKVFDLLIASKGKLTSNRIVQSLNMSKPKALQTMIEFKAIGLVEIGDSEERGANNLPLRQITLRPEFDWFLTDEFERLREGFVPTDHRDYMKKSIMIEDEDVKDDKSVVVQGTRKGNGTHTHNNLDYENENGNGLRNKIKQEELSWPLYHELEEQELEDSANHMQADKNKVSRTKLHSALVASGYHVILPLYSNGIILEDIKEFERVDNISLKFLRYAESYLSLNKSDSQHNYTISFNNCMLRIPGSFNSKNGQTVKIIQKWDGIRPEINYLLAGFSRYIINERYIELMNAEKRKQRKSSVHVDQNNRVNWIERLLQTPLQDHRKYCIWRILVPYLLNIRSLSEQEVTDIIRDWLNRCNQLRQLDFNYKQKIKDGIEGAKEGYLPISQERLRNENSRLYFLLQDITNY